MMLNLFGFRPLAGVNYNQHRKRENRLTAQFPSPCGGEL